MHNVKDELDPYAFRNDQSMVEGSGAGICQRTMGENSLSVLRPDSLSEPPGADPLARWCGARGRKTPGYPIIKKLFPVLV